MTLRAKLAWLAVFAVAFAWVESAVVVYLREIYYPEGFRLPILIIADWMAAIEVGREAATLAMLASVAALAGADRWQKFLLFAYCFGIWDIFYYVWLRVFLRWPESLLTWDVLFLIPVPWLGPVLAPVIVSLCLVGGSSWLLRLQARGARLAFSPGQWALCLAGGCLVLASFMLDYQVTLSRQMPPPFRWWLFGAGMAAALAALGLGVASLPRTGRE